MFKLKNHIFTNLIAILIITTASVLLSCADRDDIPETNEPDTGLEKATQALNQAESAMERAGIQINFTDIGNLADLPAILPAPLELGQLADKGAIQEAIGAMYEVLDALGENSSLPQAPANPAQAESKASDSDLMLTHIHIAYLYVLEAVRILTIEGWGKDGVANTEDDLFKIAFKEAPKVEDLDTVYKFELTERGQTRFNQIANNPSRRPEDYLKEFRASERQAILNALVLLISAEVKTPTFPNVKDIDGQPIGEQAPQVNRTICRRDALYHLEKAFDIAKKIAPDLAESFDEFNEVIAEAFVEDFLDQVKEWGFEILNEDELTNRINELIENV